MAKKILRWLLSNLLVILVIISVIYSYIYWGNLTGENTPAVKAVAFLSQKFDGVDTFVEGVKNKQARLAGAKPGQHSVAESVADMSETEIPTTDAPVNSRESFPQGNMQPDTATEEMAIEKQDTADTKDVSLNNVDDNESGANKSGDETSALSNSESGKSDSSESEQGQPDVESSDESDKSVSDTAVAASGNELVNTEPVAEDSKLAVTEQVEAGSSQIESEQQPASIRYSHNNTQVKQTSDGEFESLTTQQPMSDKTEVLSASESESTGDTQTQLESEVAKNGFISAEVAKQVESVQDDGVLPESEPVEQASLNVHSITEQPPINKTEMSIQDTWVLARSSFYQKKYALSEKSYQSVIAATKDNFDAYGELGNVYFSQGKKSKAADAYLRAATILFTKGYDQRAQSLLRVLQQLDVSKANQLQLLMDVPSL